MTGCIRLTAEAGVKIRGISDGDYTRIELRLIALFLSEQGSVFVMNVSIELERSLRLIALGYSNYTLVVENIEEVVVAIRTDSDIRSIKTSFVLLIIRIIGTLKGNTFISPVPEIVNRCRPRNIVAGTEEGTVIVIVRSVDVETVAEYVWFAIRNIFPGRKIRIEGLFLGGSSKCSDTGALSVF